MEVLVSVIMTAYNSERYIGEAIESILGQTYRNWELIIVEDGSTDDTLQVIKRYSDPRIRLFCNVKNCGTLYSMQKAMREVQGEYVAILDSDDVSMPKRIEKQVFFLQEHPEIMLCATKANNIVNGKIKKINYPPNMHSKKLRFMALFVNPYMVHSTIMFRKNEIENRHIRYEKFSYCHDYYFVLQVAAVGQLYLLDEVLGSYRIHLAQKTSALSKRKIQRETHGARMAYVKNMHIWSDKEKIILCRAIKGKVKSFREYWILQRALKRYVNFCGLGNQDRDLVRRQYTELFLHQEKSIMRYFFGISDTVTDIKKSIRILLED